MKNLKNKIFLIVSCCFFAFFSSCSTDRKSVDVQNETVLRIDTVFVRDTIYLDRNLLVTASSSLFAVDVIYLTLDRMYRGNIWQNEQDEYFFYRLLFASVGDMEVLYIEKIKWIHDMYDHFELISRRQVLPKDFGGNWWYDFKPTVQWISPTVVKISFTTDDWEDRSIREFYLDIPRMKVAD